MKKGFSLIELVIIISVLAVIMVTVSNVMINSFRARSRVDIGSKLEQNGNSALAEIKDNVLKTDGRNVSCVIGSGVGTSISFINNQDGIITTLFCNEGSQVASISAVGVSWPLTSSDVKVTGCNTFVSCDTLPSSETVSVANFKFTVGSGTTGAGLGPESYVSRKFETKVIIRQ